MDIYELEEVAQKILSMLENEQFAKLASDYGYALAFDLNPAIALKNDLLAAQRETGVSFSTSEKTISIQKFSEGDLSYLINCIVGSSSKGIQVEIILNAYGNLYIEQVSGFA